MKTLGDWNTNADLIADVAKLGYLDGTVLDVTYGYGRFWTKHRPAYLIGVDLNPKKTDPTIGPVDFTAMPFPDGWADTVVYDPPYRLSGTPSLGDFDEAYGIEAPTSWRSRIHLIGDGARECARVARRHLLVKVQDQVVSGQMRWQTDVVVDAVTPLGWRKADRFEFSGGSIPQPAGRRQVHALHAGVSQMLAFTRGRVDNG